MDGDLSWLPLTHKAKRPYNNVVLWKYVKAIGTGGAGGLGPPNIFEQKESALFQQSRKHFLFSLTQS